MGTDNIRVDIHGNGLSSESSGLPRAVKHPPRRA